MKIRLILAVLILNVSVSVFADNLSNSNKLFEFAEKNYSQFFSPPGAETIEIAGYIARYYGDTGNYLGTLGEDVYVYGEEFGGLLHVGKITDYISIEDSVNTGLWQGSNIRFNVATDGQSISEVGSSIVSSDGEKYAIELRGISFFGACSGTSTIKISSSRPYPIEDNKFKISDSAWTISGTFNSPHEASGVYSMRNYDPSCFGYVYANGNWTASPVTSIAKKLERNTSLGKSVTKQTVIRINDGDISIVITNQYDD